MTTSRATALLLVSRSPRSSRISTADPAAASATQATATTQQSKPIAVHATQDKRQILVVSGTLSLLSTREATSLPETLPASRHPHLRLRPEHQKRPRLHRDAVNILYVANGPSNLASSSIAFSPHWNQEQPRRDRRVASVKTQAPPTRCPLRRPVPAKEARGRVRHRCRRH